MPLTAAPYGYGTFGCFAILTTSWLSVKKKTPIAETPEGVSRSAHSGLA
jgi:hypothetical protein